MDTFDWFGWIVLPLIIFVARTCDMSLTTIRGMLLARGIRAVAFDAGFVQSAESDPLVVNVFAPPLILAQPLPQLAVDGGVANFNVAALGPGRLAYQWRFNGAPIAAATNAALALFNVQAANVGLFDVVVSSPATTV